LFAYLIIAIELAILYTVFWYVFLREPRPYKIRENIWGNYQEGNRAGSFESACAACETVSQKNLNDWKNELAIKAEWQVEEIHTLEKSVDSPELRIARAIRPIELQRSPKKGVEKIVLNSCRHLDGDDATTSEAKSISFLAKLSETINTLSTKLP
jgi:hypothetical protein